MRGAAGRVVRTLPGLVLAVAAVAVMGALTRFGYGMDGEAAELRLAWRAVVTSREACRPLTAGEQAELPAHMRRTEICQEVRSGYRLAVEVDGTAVHRSALEAAGARGDRPLYVFETLRLAPGRHHLRVSFRREEPAGDDSAGVTATDADTAVASRDPARQFPASLVLDRVLEVRSGDVVLVTYDPASRALVATTGG